MTDLLLWGIQAYGLIGVGNALGVLHGLNEAEIRTSGRAMASGEAFWCLFVAGAFWPLGLWFIWEQYEG